MERVLGLTIAGLAVVGGICGIIWPELYRSSLEEAYTRRRARIGSMVLLLLGLATLYAIFAYAGGPVDFFPA